MAPALTRIAGGLGALALLAPAVGLAQDEPAVRLRVDRGILGARYQYIENGGVALADHLQHQLIAAGRLALGRSTTVALRATVATGDGFRSGWNSTGIGNTEAVWPPYLEQLALVVTTPGGLELEAGGIAPDLGGISEVTGFDVDAYLVGVQLRIGPEAGWPVDRVVITAGDLGDLTRSAVTRRLERFGRVSYGQLLVATSLGRVGLTGEYSFRDGVSTGHGAVRVETADGRWAVRWEGFARSSDALGVAGVVELVPVRRVHLELGYASVDPPVLNGDKYGPGERVFANVAVALSPVFDLSVYGTERLGGAAGFERRVDLMLRYDWRTGLGLQRF